MIRRTIKNRMFWVGVGVGVFAGPVVIGRVAPSLQKKIPGA